MSTQFDNVSLPNLGSAVWNHRYKALSTFLVLLCLTAAIYLLVPRKYGSEGKIFVQLGRGSVQIDPSALGSNTLSLNESRETEIKSIVEVLKSRDLAGKVADDVGVDRILKTKWKLPSIPFLASIKSMVEADSEDGEMSAEEYEAHKDRELAIKKLMDDVVVDAEKKTTVIFVWAEAQSPQLARDITKSYLDKFREQHLEIHRTDRSFDFFDREFTKQQERLSASEEMLSKFRSENGFLSIEGTRALQQVKIDRLQLAIQDVETQADASQARIDEHAQQLGKMNETIRSQVRNQADDSAIPVREQLNQLEIELASRRSKLPPGHPKLVEIEEQVATATKILKGMNSTWDESTTSVNPNFLASKAAKMTEQNTLTGLDRSLQSLRKKLGEARVTLEDLNSKELVAKRLKQNIAVEQSAFQVYANRRAEAAVQQQLDVDQITNVKVYQRPELVLKPISPRLSILGPLGMAFSVIGALLVALFAEARKMKNIDPREIEDRIGLPILVDIPRVTPSQAILN